MSSDAGPQLSIALDDLGEDWLTSWTTDVADNVDAALLLRAQSSLQEPLIQWLRVPKPDGERMNVPVLDPESHIALHIATAQLRDTIDETLSPSVFGYRRGADATARYATEWQKFFSLAGEMAADAASVIIADVERFFSAASWGRVIAAIEAVTTETEPVRRLAASFESAGLPHLPAGYGDARMLSNLLLLHVDRRLPVPFLRWVDDYRLFIPRGKSAHEVLENLDQELRYSGLHLNRSKTLVLSHDQAVARHTNTLRDVYRPEQDPPDVVRTALRRVFTNATADPAGLRRDLRFALARLEREKDDFAIDKALDLLRTCPWEAPRLVSYLGRFAADERVRTRIPDLLAKAAVNDDAWLVSQQTADSLAIALPQLRRSPAWGLALRGIALVGDAERVVNEISTTHPDARAALVALRDLDAHLPAQLIERQPELALALISDPAPLPRLRSLL